MIQSHFNLAKVYQDLEYKDQALDHFKQALKAYYVHLETEEENLSFLFTIQFSIINSCFILGNYHQCLL